MVMTGLTPTAIRFAPEAGGETSFFDFFLFFFFFTSEVRPSRSFGSGGGVLPSDSEALSPSDFPGLVSSS